MTKQFGFWNSGFATCDICGRALTDPQSVARGIGPVCAGKNGGFGDMNIEEEREFHDLADTTPLEGGIVLRRADNGVFTNVPHLVTHHSPSGFEWGYGGSGPADLALNILELFLNRMGYEGRRVECWKGDCWDLAWELHQDFKWQFICGADRQEQIIPYETIEGYVNTHIQAKAVLER